MGRWLACAAKGIQVYDLSTTAIVDSQRTANHHPWSPNHLRFSRDEEMLFAWLDTWNTLTKCDLNESTEELKAETIEGDANSILSAALPKVGVGLLTAGGDGELRLHNFSTGEYGVRANRSKLHDWPIHCFGLDPSGRWLATAAWDGTLRLWDMATDDPRSSPLVLRTRKREIPGGVAISPDGKWLAQPADEYVEVWNTDKPYSRPILLRALASDLSSQTDDSKLVRAAFGGNVLLTTKLLPQDRNEVRLWDFAASLDDGVTGRLLAGVEIAAITRQSGKLILVRPDHHAYFCDVQTVLATPESSDPFVSATYIGRHDFSPHRLIVGPNDRWLIGLCRRYHPVLETKLYVWDLHAEDVKSSLRMLDVGEQFIWNEEGVDITRTGRWLVTGGGRSNGDYLRTVCIFDLRDLSKPPKIIEQNGDVWEVEMHDSGRWLYVNRRFGKPELRDLTTGMVHYFDEGFQHGRMSPDGRWLACAGRTHYNAYLYDLQTEKPLVNMMVLRGHEAPIWNVEFTDDSRWLVTSSSDGTMRRWCMDNDWLVDFAKTIVGRDLSPKERSKYGLTEE